MLSGLLWPLVLLAAYTVFVRYLWRETGRISLARSEPTKPSHPSNQRSSRGSSPPCWSRVFGIMTS